MAGGVASLLDVSRRALFAQTQAIRVLGSNIANVNTPGYTRRKAEMQALQPSNVGDDAAFGTGVEVSKVVRVVDTFLNRELETRINQRAKFSVRDELLLRAEQSFSLESAPGKIGNELSEFFSVFADLAQDPANIALRTQVIEQGNLLTGAINSTYDNLASLQREADSRLGVLVEDVNRISAQIASLNVQIASVEVSNQESLTLRDQREQLLRELSERIEFDTVDNGDGTILVSLSSGFALVTSTGNNNLEFTRSPDFAPVGGFETGLDGAGLGYIVYDFDKTAGTAHVDLTNTIARGGGEIAGLLTFRGTPAAGDTSPFDNDGTIVEIAARVEALARDLLTRFNLSYLGPDENTTTPLVHNPSVADLNGNIPTSPYALFSAPGLVDDGDGFPDDLASNVSYARNISFGITDPSTLAVALDLNPANGATSFAPGDGSNIENILAVRSTANPYALGSFSATLTIDELYDNTVSFVGGVKNTAEREFFVARDRESQVRELQASVSGVSLDEEFANLINFQRAFEASARIIRVGDELLAQILGII